MELETDNRRLSNKVAELELQSKSQFQTNSGETSPNSKSTTSLREMEFKLAETRSKLARTQQLNEDFTMGKEQLTRELEYEKVWITNQ